MPSPTLILLALLGLPGVALALPQFSVRSARRCDTCHVDPKGWEDPQMSERKCSLDCGTCHVSPSGGGMRTASGLYYQSKALPMWGTLRSGADYRIDALTHLWSNPQRGDQITLAASQPTVAESDRQVPAPGTAARWHPIPPRSPLTTQDAGLTSQRKGRPLSGAALSHLTTQDSAPHQLNRYRSESWNR